MTCLIDESEYRIIYMDMPCSLKAFVSVDDGFYNIFVNSRLCCEQNMKSIEHEFSHILNMDFENFSHVDRIEKIRHRIETSFQVCI